VLDALSSGILIYTGLVEVLSYASDLMNRNWYPFRSCLPMNSYSIKKWSAAQMVNLLMRLFVCCLDVESWLCWVVGHKLDCGLKKCMFTWALSATWAVATMKLLVLST
jgi:hypothetical protein